MREGRTGTTACGGSKGRDKLPKCYLQGVENLWSDGAEAKIDRLMEVNGERQREDFGIPIISTQNV